MRSSLVWLSMVLLASRIEAQHQPVVGQRVRVTAEGRRYTGRLVTWTTDTVVVSEGGNSAILERRTVNRLERETARKRGFGHGAAVGLIAGVVLGGVLGASADDQWVGGGTVVLGGMFVMGGFGAAIGGIAGALTSRSSWEPVSLDGGGAGVGLKLVVSPAAVGAGVQIRFR